MTQLPAQNTIIQNSVWSTTLGGKPQTKHPEYPWEVNDQIKLKGKLRRRWQMSQYLEHKCRYNEATRKLNNQIKRIKEETFQTYI
jgi:predicted glycoside hydrolase/deacetylase ChbG (UPF0249 family)